MIINIRGTSGSGKSTLVRAVMALYDAKEPIHVEKRKQPVGYVLRTEGRRPLFIPGHYETACGGCDTLPGYDEIYKLVKEHHALGEDVLFEGLLASGEAQRAIELHQQTRDLKVIALTTPLEVCIASINERRRAKKADAPPVAEKNTKAKMRAVELAVKRMKDAEVPVEWADREGALGLVKDLLQWS